MFAFKKIWVSGLLVLLLSPIVACSPSSESASSSGDTKTMEPLVTGAIPDQDPEKLQRLYTKLADYLEAELGVPVEYKPVTDYTAAVTAFRVGDLDLVWFGGLTGVQARLQVEGAEAIAQRDIDSEFTSVFIANKNSGINSITDSDGLQKLKGHTFTFGSESSTSGRLMPQYFLEKAGVMPEDFKGEVGFSQSHDATLQLVEAGTYEAGALNSQVWKSRVEEGEVDLDKVQVIWETPTYYDYHWVINPEVKEQYGEDFSEKVQAALLKLDPKNPEHQEILELFGADKFIPTKNENYTQIEEVGRKIGKIK
ncbi:MULTISPECIES: putative selenate ABC transporter substrate-binding protein [unclassified Coleofasciculus]|uniref:putative selenate ABC transporter substrate-binding protein n=1 Tax=unclassified Coleofasciculus TaxID=2692782 RepID=UPI001882916F|nr:MULTISPECIES: putative selenate ABC transporter substrate-binding protein [unclassified Coleofasciculus]MBE9126352.1 putative selenate ABC transporter substrate-binding protein [Coleofasciculus sp. LEGE 07081]MBE9150005.1 putative selenate ABC transporter substrate-binding protein [Coleofasciculus sp. LEGE 07092]